jgi:hypothetical protein
MYWRQGFARYVLETGLGKRRIQIFVGKPEGKRLLGRTSRRLEDNIRWIFRNWDVGVSTGSSGLRIGTGGGHL